MGDEKWVGKLRKGRDLSKTGKKKTRSGLAMSQTTKGMVFWRTEKMVVVVKEKREVAKRG